jgi:hypothetical protein
MQNNIPIFLHNPTTKKILDEVVPLIPKNTKVYLFAGTIRNAIYFSLTGETMTQRDFDCIIIGDGEQFANNLVNAGFIFGSKNSEKSKVLKKARIDTPVHKFDDWVYLDCKIFSSEHTIIDILNTITDLTLSGVALNMQDINSEHWNEAIVELPHARQDIENKIIRVVTNYPLNIYKIIRLVSQGFTLSENVDIPAAVNKRVEASTERLQKEIEKTVTYVGSKEATQEILARLGITQNIVN